MATELTRDLAHAIIDQSADAIIFADADGVTRVWNAAASAIFGFTAEETIGRSLDMIIPERLREAHWSGFRRAVESGVTRLDGRPTITRGLHKSGKRLYVEMSFAVVRAPDGTVAGSVAIARDATARYEQQRANQGRA
jgi:PAS domain S-box-containing protein